MTGMESIKRAIEPDALEHFSAVDAQIEAIRAWSDECFVLWLIADLERRIEE